MVTLEQIKSNLQDVTSEQIGRCHKVIDLQTNEDFYQVESESDPTVEYEARYSPEHGFTCTCKAGQVGFSKITFHPSGVCKHVRWAVAAFLEEEAAMQEMSEKIEHQAKLRHNAALPAIKVSSIEASLPKWLKNKRPAPHMRRAPREI